MTPAEARALHLAAEPGATIACVLIACLGRDAGVDLLRRFERDGLVDQPRNENDDPFGPYYVTALGRREAAKYTPTLLHHAGACVPNCQACAAASPAPVTPAPTMT